MYLKNASYIKKKKKNYEKCFKTRRNKIDMAV